MRIRNILLGLCVMYTCNNIYADEKHRASIGVGGGISFGLLGAKLDYAIHENTFVTMGIGERPSIGIQYFFRDRNSFWRPRIYLGYGYVSNINMKRSTKDHVKENFSGTAIGIGQVFQIGRRRTSAIEFDIIIPISDGGKSERKAELEAQGYEDSSGVFLYYDQIWNHINIGYRYSYEFN